MSHHSRELYPHCNTDEIRAELALHGMAVDKPSMMSDAFRFGWLAARSAKTTRDLIEELKRVIELDLSNKPQQEKMLSILQDKMI